MRCPIATAIVPIAWLALACEGPAGPGPGPAAPGVVRPGPLASTASSPDDPLSAKDAGTPPAVLGPNLCGCGLCAPVLSADTCSSGGDCTPATPCHATRCVATANAEPRKPDTMCTQDLHCDAIEANACGCVAGKCALVPRTK